MKKTANHSDVFDRLPNGWRFIPNATTAPNGYMWACNGKTRFGGEFRHALIKVK